MDKVINVSEADDHPPLLHNSQSTYCQSRRHWSSDSAVLWCYPKWL